MLSMLVLVMVALGRVDSADAVECSMVTVDTPAQAATWSDVHARLRATKGATRRIWMAGFDGGTSLVRMNDAGCVTAPFAVRRTQSYTIVASDARILIPVPSDVQVHIRDDDYELPAGRYRVRIVYALSERAWKRGDLCVAESNEFVVAQPDPTRRTR